MPLLYPKASMNFSLSSITASSLCNILSIASKDSLSVLIAGPIPLFSNIYVEYPYPAYVSFPYAPKLTQGTNYNVVNSDAETPIGNKNYPLFAMYTALLAIF